MKVSFRESIDIDAERKLDIIAFAGLKGVYRHGMYMRDAIKALMAILGTSWQAEMLAAYPVNDQFPPRAKRVRAPSTNGPSGAKRRKKHTADEGVSSAVSA